MLEEPASVARWLGAITWFFTIPFRATLIALAARSFRAGRIATITFRAASIRAALSFRAASLCPAITLRTAVSLWTAITIGASSLARRTDWATDQFGRIKLAIVIGVEFIEEIDQLG